MHLRELPLCLLHDAIGGAIGITAHRVTWVVVEQRSLWSGRRAVVWVAQSGETGSKIVEVVRREFSFWIAPHSPSVPR